MSINLVSLAMKFVTPDMLLKLAGATGLQGIIVQKALGAIVPAILGGLVGKAAKPDGARALFDILGKQDPGLLGKIGGMIGGTGQAELIKQGAGLLASVLGGGAATGLAGAVGKFAGIGDGPANTLMGLLAPAVLGSVGQQARESKLDAGSLATMLAGQKDNISAAMPAGFSDLLKGTGLLDGVMGSAGAAMAGAASSAAGRVTGAAGHVGHVAANTAKGTSMGWLPWVLGLAVLAGLGWYFVNGTKAPKIAAPAAPAALTAGASEAANQVTALFNGMRNDLGAIKDVESAKVALPKLQGAVGGFEKVSGLVEKLPPEARKAVAGTVAGFLPGIEPLFKTVLAIPGASDLLKPVIDLLQGKIAALAKG